MPLYSGPPRGTIGTIISTTDENGNAVRAVLPQFQAVGAGGGDATALGTYNTTPPTLTNGQTGSFQLGARGAQHVQIMAPDAATPLTVQRDDLDGVATATTNSKLVVMARKTVWNGTNWDRARGDTVSAFSRPAPRAKSASGVTAGSTTTQQLFAANATRSRVVIQNQDAAINVFVNLGAAAVAGAGNLRISPGATLELTGTSEAINLIAASGTPAICAWEF